MEENILIAKKWAERYGYIRIYSGVMIEAKLINNRRKFFPLSLDGLKMACQWIAFANQDPYRELPEFN